MTPRRCRAGRGGDEHFRAGDQLEPARMMLADPRLVIIEPVEMLQQLEVALDRQGRVLVVIMERRQEDAAAQIEIAHVALPRGWDRARALLSSMSRVPRVPASEFPGCRTCRSPR